MTSVHQSMPVKELELKPTNWKVAVMSKQDITLLLWAKHWIHMLFLPSLKARNRIPGEAQNSVWIPIILPSLFTIPPSSFLPVQMVFFFVSQTELVLTAFKILNTSKAFLFSSSQTEIINSYLCRIMLGLAVTKWLLDPTSLVYSLDKGGRLHLEKQEQALQKDLHTFKSSQLSWQIGILLSLAQFTNYSYHLSLLMGILWLTISIFQMLP